jgi:hypothetical protein
MDSKIDQEVIDELIAMLEGHISSGLGPKKEELVPGVEAEEGPADLSVGDPLAAKEPEEEDDEDMKKLMEMYSRG